MGADSTSEQQSRRLIDAENLERRSSSGSSDFDVEDDPLYTPPPTKSPLRRRRRRKNTLTRFGTIQCPTINRKTKLLVFVISLVVLLFTSLAVYRKRHGHLLKKKPEPPPEPKPTFCSTWPRRDGKRDLETRDAQLISPGQLQKSERSELISRAKWKKPSGFKIIATVFCTCWTRSLSEELYMLTLSAQMAVDETLTYSIATFKRISLPMVDTWMLYISWSTQQKRMIGDGSRTWLATSKAMSS